MTRHADEPHAPELIENLFRLMCEVRAFESIASERYRAGELPGFIHLSLGQEASAAGACAALRGGDYITSTHRGHGHCLAKGADPRLMMAELFAKAQGYGKGRGGSMHIADVAAGVLGANGIVGQSLGLGIGAALSIQVRRTGNVALAFFGEGASGAGIAHESMNIAAIWKLPVIFFCETNRYAELSPYETHVSTPSVSDRAKAYGFPGESVDGEDVLAVYDAALRAAARARNGDGPTLIEAKTYRWHGHYEGDPQLYKTELERKQGTDFDPIARLKHRSPDLGISLDRLIELELAAKQKIAAAAEWAAGLQTAPASSMTEDVYAEV